MSFIGIITNQKNESYILKNLSQIISHKNIIFISDKNISNIKNVRFDSIVIDKDIDNKIDLNKIIFNSNFLILNVDIELNLQHIDTTNTIVLTYGFNHKSTFTVSSVEDENMIICLQRVIFNKKKKSIEPQEFKVTINKNVDKYIIIATEILKILYN